jgi:apolipoprotein N-acyltransferase
VTLPLRAQRVLLSLGAGLALALAFPDYNLPVLGWVSVAGLMAASLDAKIGEAALCGLLYGGMFYSFSLPWIYTVLRQYGPLTVGQALGATSLLILATSLFCSSFAVALAWISRRSPSLAILASPFLWVTTEYARANLPDIGYPWNLVGYTASGSLALVQLASVTGIFGLSFLVVSYNAVLVWSLRLRTRRALLSLAVFTSLLLVAGAWGGRFVPAARPSAMAHLVQTNLPVSTNYPADWDVTHAADMEEIDQITVTAAKNQPGLVVWPEVPAPFSLQQPPFARRVTGLARDAHAYFLLGVVDWKPAGNGVVAPYNSAALFDPQGQEQFLYDKMHLVPFSEYVPWRRFFWFANNLTSLVGDFQRGTEYRVGELPGGRFSVFICYEAIFPDQVRRFVLGGAELLINISDDGWFGNSSARSQHLAIARVRAVENRRWLLRDTNNGMTASVDPYGRIVARMAADIRGQLDAPYGFRNDETIYTRWGDWVAELSVVVSILLLTWVSLPAKRAPAPRRGRKGKKKR